MTDQPSTENRRSVASAPSIITTPPPGSKVSQRHRPRGSIASPIDIIAQSPTARKMSMSSTPQSVIPLSGPSSSSLAASQIFISGIIASIVLTGIMISLIFNTSLNTSLHTHQFLPERTAYLARKSNILNQLFVKKSWGWTSFAFLFHLISSPPSRTPRWTRLSAWILSTTAWILFTTWFFGAGLGDRIIALSGGDCAVAIPKEWASGSGSDLTASSFLSSLSSVTPPGKNIYQSEDDIFVPLSHQFCAHRRPLNPSTHPALFALFPSHDITQRGAIPRWHKGFDISGHTFLLTLSVLILARELAPSWRTLYRGSTGAKVGRGGALNSIATVFGTALLGLWFVMLASTAVYFHNPPEKLSGLALGLITAAAVNILTPDRPVLLSSATISTSALAGLTGQDENTARRGQVVDDGVIIDDLEDAIEDRKDK